MSMKSALEALKEAVKNVITEVKAAVVKIQSLPKPALITAAVGATAALVVCIITLVKG